MDDIRSIIAKALLRKRKNRGWKHAPDGVVPADAVLYAVYDGEELIGGGVVREKTNEFVAGLVSMAEVPIVLWAGRRLPFASSVLGYVPVESMDSEDQVG